MKEVQSPKEANRVAIISKAFGSRSIVKKIYFWLPANEKTATILTYIAKNYGFFIKTDMRLDIYLVRNGYVVGRE